MFLTIIFYIFVVLAIVGSGVKIGKEISSRHTYAIGAREKKAYSWASLQLMKEYNELPAGNRPLGDITYPLRALDTKYDAEDVTRHFSRQIRGYERTRTVYGWDNCFCGYRGCGMAEYKDMHNGIGGIKDALREQAHALQLAGVESGLSEAAEITARLREEVDVIETVTKELTAR